MKTIELIGAPFDLGASVRGASMGPAALRVAGLAGRLTALGHPVIDSGDLVARPVTALHLEGRTHDEAEVAGWARVLDDAAHASLAKGRTPVFLGGDPFKAFLEEDTRRVTAIIDSIGLKKK